MKYTSLLILLLSTACTIKQPITVVSSNNQDYQISYLFEYDGCKVYSFRDGNTHYFTNCTGTINRVPYQCGKVTCYRSEEINGKKHK